ncbi:MAG: zf-HC2 domain-containing protein [Nitrospinota bacterium]
MFISISCKEASRLVSLSMDTELSFLQRVSLKFHLSMCKHCKQFARQINYIRELSGQLKIDPSKAN